MKNELLELVKSLKDISMKGIENDKSILKVINLLTGCIRELEVRVSQAEDNIDQLKDHQDVN